MKKSVLLALFTIVTITPLGLWAWSEVGAQQHIQHGNHASQIAAGEMPNEAGQSAFAAIAEIVALLQADPETDWASVDIDGLRKHLVDMDALTLNTKATVSVRGNNLVINVVGDERGIVAIHSMVPAHAQELNRSSDWDIEVKELPTGALITIRVDSPGKMMKLKALGFYGIMATGAHHQKHHLAMASGKSHLQH